MKLTKFTFFRITILFLALSLSLYKIIEKQNKLIQIQKNIPLLKKKQSALQWQISQLQYKKDSFESPIHLMKLSQRPQYSHLKYPTDEDVVKIHE